MLHLDLRAFGERTRPGPGRRRPKRPHRRQEVLNPLTSDPSLESITTQQTILCRVTWEHIGRNRQDASIHRGRVAFRSCPVGFSVERPLRMQSRNGDIVSWRLWPHVSLRSKNILADWGGFTRPGGRAIVPGFQLIDRQPEILGHQLVLPVIAAHRLTTVIRQLRRLGRIRHARIGHCGPLPDCKSPRLVHHRGTMHWGTSNDHGKAARNHKNSPCLR